MVDPVTRNLRASAITVDSKRTVLGGAASTLRRRSNAFFVQITMSTPYASNRFTCFSESQSQSPAVLIFRIYLDSPLVFYRYGSRRNRPAFTPHHCSHVAKVAGKRHEVDPPRGRRFLQRNGRALRTARGIDEAGLDGGLHHGRSRRERNGRGDAAFELEREGTTTGPVTLPQSDQGEGGLSVTRR